MRVRFRGQRDVYDRLTRDVAAEHGAHQELRRRVDAATRFGAYPDGLVWVESRLAALLNGAEDHGLRPVRELVDGAAAAAELVGVSIDAPERAELGRCDLTSELDFRDGTDGVELLRAASYVDVPWLKVGTEGGKRDRVETVYWRGVNGRSTVLRLYDKGVETGTAGPGERVRLERQRRYRKSRAPSIAQLLDGDVAAAFVGRELVRLVDELADVHVCDRLGAVQRLRELHRAGGITAGRLRRSVAFVMLGDVGLGRATAYRHASELRSAGIALNLNEREGTAVPVAQLLARFAEPWAAAAA